MSSRPSHSIWIICRGIGPVRVRSKSRQEELTLGTFKLGALWTILLSLLLSSAGVQAADELVRGLVVDRGDKSLWIGLPVPVQRGTVFNVYLVPGNEPIARATVTEITPDPPYVARASVKLLRSDAFIPVGAYVEVVGDVLPATDSPGGFRDVDFRPQTAGRLSLSASAFFPTGGDLEDETTGVWPSFHLAYRICEKQAADLQVGVGYFHGDGDFTEGLQAGTREFRVIPLTVEARIPMSASRTGGWFSRIGVGAYYVRDQRTLGGIDSSENTVTFGWQAGFGYVSARGRSAEFYYTDVSETDFQGFAFSLGTRF